MQLAKAYGAHVTGVDSGEKLPLIRALGADQLIDYRREDFTRGAQRYDLIFDVASTLALEDCKRVLNPAGVYVRIGHEHFGEVGGPLFGSLPGFFKLVARSMFDRSLPKMSGSFPGKRSCMEVLGGLLAAGKLTPVVDKVYPLNGVADAIRYLASGQALGKIVIAPQESFHESRGSTGGHRPPRMRGTAEPGRASVQLQ
jgi:NADPH:quinone reductase-like Zn-dependent oxidoreductase